MLKYFISNSTIQLLASYYGYFMGDSLYYSIEKQIRHEIDLIQYNVEVKTLSEICDVILSEIHQSKKTRRIHRTQSILKNTATVENTEKHVSFRDQIMTTINPLKNNIGNAIFKILKDNVPKVVNIKETMPVYSEDDIKKAAFEIYNEARTMNKYRKRYISNSIKLRLELLKIQLKKYYQGIKECDAMCELCGKLIMTVSNRYKEYSTQDTEAIVKSIESYILNIDL